MFCSRCGSAIENPALACRQCQSQPATAKKSDPLLRAVLPVDRSGHAIAAGYLALFSILFIPAPLALLFGILALRDIKAHPEKHGLGRAWFGVIMGGLFSMMLLLMIAKAMLR